MAATSFGRITRVMLTGLDLLLIALVALAVATGAQAGQRPWLMAPLGAAFLAVYVIGRVTIRTHITPVDAPRGRWWPNGLWVVALIVLWSALLLTSPSGLWIAFPLALITMHTLGPVWGTAAVALITVHAIGHSVWLADPVTVGTWLGPLLGSVVAVTVLLGLEALARETQQRQRLLDELAEARGWLAEAERDRAVVGEHERLAREIHDTLAQGFSAIDLLLRAAAPQLPAGPAADLIGRAGDTARENLVEARRFVRDLPPAELAEHPLTDALRRATDHAAAAGGLRARTRIEGASRPLPMVTEAAVLRIVQSALANVTRHARAETVTVTLTYRPTEVQVDIVDDGVGFDLDAPAPDGFGLRGMRSRVAELGGRLAVLTAPGEGTTITVTLPQEER